MRRRARDSRIGRRSRATAHQGRLSVHRHHQRSGHDARQGPGVRRPPRFGRRQDRGEVLMKIVVLDGCTLNPGDLSWDELASLGECRIHDRSSPDEVVKRAADAEIVLTNKTVLTREQILNLHRLKYIGVLATGYNIVDVAAARERNIPVTNVPTYGNP